MLFVSLPCHVATCNFCQIGVPALEPSFLPCLLDSPICIKQCTICKRHIFLQQAHRILYTFICIFSHVIGLVRPYLQLFLILDMLPLDRSVLKEIVLTPYCKMRAGTNILCCEDQGRTLTLAVVICCRQMALHILNIKLFAGHISQMKFPVNQHNLSNFQKLVFGFFRCLLETFFSSFSIYTLISNEFDIGFYL